jgi:signal transduction histidine kinase
LSSTYDEILRLSHVVDALLNLSRMQAGTLRPELQEVDFHSLLKEFHLEALVLAREKKISFKFVEGGRLSIQADPGQLRQVLLNLLDNAIKYTPVKGSIEMSYTVEENELVFQIRNSGEGIAPGIVPKIFDPFRSGEKENALNQGAGLGLALVKWIVEGHRGTVEVRSTPGEDTTFVIRLPIRAGS